ncbi:MAG: type III-A CRISPR-associated protein Cas10/Csm1, partial [Anaerolineae bacterium]
MADAREFQTVVLAALLHDVGKLLQRGSFGALDVKGPHPQVSADFVSAFRPLFESVADTDVLATLVRRHHENESRFARDLLVQGIEDPHVRTLASLVSLSDNLSSSERGQRTEQWQDFKFVPLAPVLPRLRTVGGEATADIGARLHARPAPSPGDDDMPGIFPDGFREYAKGEMNSLLQAFGARFRALAANLDKSRFDTVISHLLSLFRAYGSCIPSNTQEEYPDVSLAEHLTGTAAIAACIYRFHAETGSLTEEAVRTSDAKRFLLVAGDLSGIQRYIFDIATQGAGGVARRLRARSFYVQLIAEVAALSVLDRLSLPVTNEIMTAGGRFYLLVPNLQSASRGIEE